MTMNQLNRYCQEKNIALPVCSFKCVGGTQHEPKWRCDFTWNGELLASFISGNKADAKAIAAGMAYQTLLDKCHAKVIETGVASQALLLERQEMPPKTIALRADALKELNEYYQARKLQLPQFIITRPLEDSCSWFATITLSGGDETASYSGIASDKQTAKTIAATKALQAIEERKSVKKPNSLGTVPLGSNSELSIPVSKKLVSSRSSPPRSPSLFLKPAARENREHTTAILVDVENQIKFIENMDRSILDDSNVHVFAFIGEHHHMSDKLAYPEKVLEYRTPSKQKNGVDGYMQMVAGIMLASDLFDAFLIVTNDNFGPLLVEHIQSPNLGWQPKAARLVTKQSHLTPVHF